MRLFGFGLRFWAASSRRSHELSPVKRGVHTPHTRPALTLLACALSLVLLASGAATARADVFGPISLLSLGSVNGGPVLQAEYAHDSAISGNGEYVAFDGSIGGVTGVWRRDLATDAIEQVAGGASEEPSISEDGQYISFTTDEGARLPELSHGQVVPEANPEARNVYVRDMANAPAASAAEEAARPRAGKAFEIVSARSGSEEPLSYTTSAGKEAPGASAVGRTAISADGQEVVFTTEAASNLVAYTALEEEERLRGETPRPHTPGGQVAVRYLDTGATELVSRCRFGCGQGAAAAAAEPVTVSEPKSGERYGGEDGGASISADGNAVAWNGYNIAQQAPTLPAETLPAYYVEPLWRTLPATASVSRRVSGGSDPEAPACAASGETSVAPESENAADPCQGPFLVETSRAENGGTGFLGKTGVSGLFVSFTPRLSADGERVAFVSEARLLSEGSDFERGSEGNAPDLFVADMAPGLTRDEALEPVTRVGAKGVDAEQGPIVDFAISPDGTQVAFSTIRTIFILGEPSLVTAPLPMPGINELYEADLPEETITRVTHGYNGGASEQPHKANPLEEDQYETDIGEQLGAFAPSFSRGGEDLVFTSTADNLVYGDGNTPPGKEPVLGPADGSDVFEVHREEFEPQPTPQQISPAPQIPLAPAWQLGVSARSLSDGSVLLYVQAPGSGVLHAGASGAVVAAFVRAASAAGKRGREAASPTTRVGVGAKVSASQASRAGRRPKTRPIARTVVTRTVAAGSLQTSGPGLSTLKLSLARPYSALARERGGFSAAVTVTFTAPGHQTLRATVPVIFAREVRRSKAPARKARVRGARSSEEGKR